MFICFKCAWCSRLSSCSRPMNCERGENLPCFLCDFADVDCPDFVKSSIRVSTYYDSIESMRNEVLQRYENHTQ